MKLNFIKPFLTGLLVSIFSIVVTHAQSVSDKGYFLVESDNFSPPTKALVASFEGKKAEPFMANDVSGTEHYLPDYVGKKVLLWFWTTESNIAVSQIGALNQIVHNHPDVQIISLAREMSSFLREYKASNQIDFPIIANADVFGQMAYGADLGYPRYFLLDKEGIIKVVLPDQAFAGEGDIYPILKGILGGI